VSTWPPLTSKHIFTSFLGTDAGLIGSIGFQVGAFTDSDSDTCPGLCIGPFLFEFTIGAGCSFPSIEVSTCAFKWNLVMP
jgi:hypothetical protein